MSTQRSPILQAPGAGLPAVEAWLLRRVLFPLGSRALPPAKAISAYLAEGERLLTLASGLSAEELTTPVLIKRQRGMEDSSRDWSVAMVLHHLTMTGLGMKEVILLLDSEAPVSREISTADVKPSAASGPEMIGNFRKLLEGFPQGLTHLSASQATHPHPWFGDLTSRKWLSLCAIHQSLHRKQAETIIANLP